MGHRLCRCRADPGRKPGVNENLNLLFELKNCRAKSESFITTKAFESTFFHIHYPTVWLATRSNAGHDGPGIIDGPKVALGRLFLV
jgi:hypothetical protein